MLNSKLLQSKVPFGTLVRTTLQEHGSLIQNWPFPPELESAHTKRKTEWALGRLALQQAFSKQRIDLEPEELVFDGHQQLLLVPGFRFSISHTDDRAVVWLADSDDCKGLGVDIEAVDRKLSDGVYKKLLHPDDTAQLSPLQLWSAKEACFKAVATEQQKDLVVAKIALQENRFHTDPPHSSGQWRQFNDEHATYSLGWRI
jgi:4'-phosphopantetheinyl transferase EntD